jgi:hypothetical protein
MQSNVKLAHAMGTTTRSMAAVNAQISPQAMQQTLQQFEAESAKMEMKEEMSKLISTQVCIVWAFNRHNRINDNLVQYHCADYTSIMSSG